MLAGMALVASALPSFANSDKAHLDDRLTSAQAVLNEIMATPDKGIPRGILAGAACVVVVPAYKKGAFLVGAQYGQGVATCRTPNGWSAPAFVRLEGGSFGWQIGGQSTDLVLIAMNQNGLQQMLKNKVKLGADAAASAGPVGRNAQAGNSRLEDERRVPYLLALEGLFAGLDLDGTVLMQNGDDTRLEYGADLPFDTILKGNQPVPDNAKPFVRTVARYFVISKDSQDGQTASK